MIEAILRHRGEWLPLLSALTAVMLAGLIVFSISRIDVSLACLFWRISGGETGRGLAMRFANAVYLMVPMLTLMLAGGALIVLTRSYFNDRFRPLRIYAIYAALVLALGPGMLVNGILKKECHRPRPRNIIELGGIHSYRKPFQWSPIDAGASFPCGDSSVGYTLIAFYLIFRKRRRRGALLTLTGSIGIGTVIGMARMLLGAHFASDVFWSGCIVFLVAFVLYYFVLNIPEREANPQEAGGAMRLGSGSPDMTAFRRNPSG